MNQETRTIDIGEHRIDPESRTIAGPSGSHRLSPKMCELIHELAAHAGEPLSRNRIIDVLWRGDGQADQFLTRHISSLRRYLGDNRRQPKYIETIPGYGYRLIAAVRIPPAGDGKSGAATDPYGGGQERGHGLSQFISALRQRKVCRAAMLYFVTLWLVCQVAEIVFPALGLPAWALSFVVVTGALGLPIVLVLAWTFELTPDDLSQEIPRNGRKKRGSAKRRFRRNMLVIGVVGLVSIQALASALNKDSRAVRDPSSNLLQADSILITPFRAASVDLETEALAFSISEELRHKLRVDAELLVYANSNDEGSYYHRRNVDLVMQGSVSIERKAVRILVHLVDPTHGNDLWSGSIDVPLANAEDSNRLFVDELVAALPLRKVNSQAIGEKSRAGDLSVARAAAIGARALDLGSPARFRPQLVRGADLAPRRSGGRPANQSCQGRSKAAVENLPEDKC